MQLSLMPKISAGGLTKEILEIPCSYATSRGTVLDGVFQFIKEADGAINHRLFIPRTS